MVYEAAALPTHHLAGLTRAFGKTYTATKLLHGMIDSATMSSSGARLAQWINESILHDDLASLPHVKAASGIGTSTAGM